ncbi:hypothetical protein EK904_013377 [Melospiza melodia maxima]|nr:hypothetical protein EK904_013377 [Melospiza melodia maxima]
MSNIFNDAMCVARCSRQEYQDNFHFKILHFLLTDPLAMLRDAQKGQRFDVFSGHVGSGSTDSVATRSNSVNSHQHGCANQIARSQGVLTPPFMTFEVTEVTQYRERMYIHLHSTANFSKYNYE